MCNVYISTSEEPTWFENLPEARNQTKSFPFCQVMDTFTWGKMKYFKGKGNPLSASQNDRNRSSSRVIVDNCCLKKHSHWLHIHKQEAQFVRTIMHIYIIDAWPQQARWRLVGGKRSFNNTLCKLYELTCSHACHHPSILQFRVAVGLEPIPATIGQKQDTSRTGPQSVTELTDRQRTIGTHCRAIQNHQLT